MTDLYASAINKMTGNVRIKDAVIHCDEPLVAERENVNIKITESTFFLENDFCCVLYPSGYSYIA